MYDWNAPAGLPKPESGAMDEEGELPSASGLMAIDAELEAAIEYKLAVSGFNGISEIVELLNRSVRRRWVHLGET
jgi:hypothetical protein